MVTLNQLHIAPSKQLFLLHKLAVATMEQGALPLSTVPHDTVADDAEWLVDKETEMCWSEEGSCDVVSWLKCRWTVTRLLEDGWRENTCTGARVCQEIHVQVHAYAKEIAVSVVKTHTHTRTHVIKNKHSLCLSVNFPLVLFVFLSFPAYFLIFAHAHRNPQTHTRLLSLSFFEASPSLSFSRTSEKLPKLVHGRVRNCFWTCLCGEERKRWEIERVCDYTYM